MSPFPLYMWCLPFYPDSAGPSCPAGKQVLKHILSFLAGQALVFTLVCEQCHLRVKKWVLIWLGSSTPLASTGVGVGGGGILSSILNHFRRQGSYKAWGNRMRIDFLVQGVETWVRRMSSVWVKLSVWREGYKISCLGSVSKRALKQITRGKKLLHFLLWLSIWIYTRRVATSLALPGRLRCNRKPVQSASGSLRAARALWCCNQCRLRESSPERFPL